MRIRKITISILMGCLMAGPVSLTTASWKWPTTALEYYSASEKSKSRYIKNRSITINRNLKESVSDFWERSSECFNIVVESYRVGTFRDKKMGSRQYTPSMKWINKQSAIFGIKVLVKDKNGVIDKRFHPKVSAGKGLFILATKFESLGKDKTKMTSYYGWGPGNKRLAKAGGKWAMGKSAACPYKYL